MSGFLLAVDYGTVHTVAVLRRPDGQVRPLLIDGSPVMSSAACIGPDGRLLVGRDAEIAGRVDPGAFVPDPRSRIDAGTVIFGHSTFPVADVIGATLSRIAQEAIRTAGGALPRLVLTHPASWAESRLATLTDAGFRTGLGAPTLVPTPVAAAWYHTQAVGELSPGRCLLTYHLGAGTFETSLLRRSAEGFDVLAVNTLPDVGGVDLDGLLLTLIGATVPPDAEPAWQVLVAPTGTAELRQFMQVCDDVRLAKEALSRQLTVGLHIPLVDRDVYVEREAFESAAEPLLTRTVDLAAGLLIDTKTPLDQVSDILLLGGSSRIPLVTTLLQRRLSLRQAPRKQPELAVAEGALTGTGRPAATPPAPAAPLTTVGARPIAELLSPMVPAAEASAEPGADPRGRRTRLLATATGLSVVLVLTGVLAIRPPNHVIPDSGRAPADTQQATSGPGAGVLSSLPGGSRAPAGALVHGSPSVPATSTSPGPGPVPSTASSSPVPEPTGTPAVTISVTATPTSGTCTTDFTFVARITVNTPGKYHWRWLFGGPANYSSASGGHDIDRTGDVQMTRKFPAQGAYWAQLQVTAPVTVSSDRVDVDVVCNR